MNTGSGISFENTSNKSFQVQLPQQVVLFPNRLFAVGSSLLDDHSKEAKLFTAYSSLLVPHLIVDRPMHHQKNILENIA